MLKAFTTSICLATLKSAPKQAAHMYRTAGDRTIEIDTVQLQHPLETARIVNQLWI